ncbi:C-type lectin domain family 4 member M-like, partial [Hypanus sabinus]|uniref:C-type lectin domain family 4 member M-like n=1 Tax=Hypanus sabinus TaxID=79690 RepID=UPI0028C4469F
MSTIINQSQYRGRGSVPLNSVFLPCFTEPAWLKPLGSNWNKVALALLGLCVALAVIALVLYIEGSRLYREETGQLALSNALQQKSSQLWDSLRLHPGGSLCSDYQQMFTHWLTAFCRLANCTSQLCHRLWSYFDGSCYYFSRAAEDWASGRQECIAQGAELLVIRSKREQVLNSRQNPSQLSPLSSNLIDIFQ